MSERSRIRNREIGFIFQAFNLIGDLTVYENVELPLTYRNMPGVGPQEEGAGGAGTRRDVAPDEALSVPTFRRPAAARGRGAGAGRRSADTAGGRADREIWIRKTARP